MPGAKYRSLKNPRAYEAMRRKGYPKRKAARISNAKASPLKQMLAGRR